MLRAILALSRHTRNPPLKFSSRLCLTPQWRRHSTSQSSQPAEASKSTELRWYSKSQLAKLSISTRKLLQQGRKNAALEYFTKSVETAIPSWRRDIRVQAYESAVNNFLDFKHYTLARTLGRNMVNKGCLSSDVQAKMIAITHLKQDVPESEHDARRKALLDELQPVVSSPHFTDRHLRHLIDLLYRPPCFDSDVCAAVVKQYADARDPDHGPSEKTENRLINLQARDKFVSRQEPTPLELEFQNADKVTPYTTMLTTLASTHRLSPTHTDAILQRMTALGVAPDLALFNALIGASVAHGDFYRAFALYDTMHAQASADFIPDAFTFGSLFKAVQAMHHPRTARTRTLKVPPNARSGRALFRDMEACHRARPAAHGIAPDTKTYRIVLVTLLAHAQLDLFTPCRWSASVVCDADAMENLLFFAARPAPGEKIPARVPSREAVLTVTLDEDPRFNTQWPVEPLLRLVTRAIWASLPHVEGEGLEEIAEVVQPVLEEMMSETSGDSDGRGEG
ncbi:hypothetical protein OF83DRAFT_1171779 [Amylostereum chailletii]|nr:hypothetical protein OF83DRAFT_1171779 [Amylostereum chailletii]